MAFSLACVIQSKYKSAECNPCASSLHPPQLPVAALSPCDVEALQKCLRENKGDRKKVRRRQDVDNCCALADCVSPVHIYAVGKSGAHVPMSSQDPTPAHTAMPAVSHSAKLRYWHFKGRAGRPRGAEWAAAEPNFTVLVAAPCADVAVMPRDEFHLIKIFYC